MSFGCFSGKTGCFLALLLHHALYRFKYFKACLIVVSSSFGYYLILVGGKANGYKGVLVARAFSSGIKAERWEENAPPVFPLSLAYVDLKREIFSGREAERAIAFCGILLPSQRHGSALRAALLVYRAVSALLYLPKKLAKALLCGIQGVVFAKLRAVFLEYRIAHLELDRLIRLTV